MAASFSLPTVLANLAAGNQALSLIDGDFTACYNPLVSLNTFSNYYTDTGAANAYVITVSSPQTVAQTAGLRVQFIAANRNSSASTFQINALAVKNILNLNGAALGAGQIPANGIVDLIYDGTQYLLLNPAGAITLSNSLAGDVALNNIATFFDGPSVAQGTAGAWWASGTVTLQDTAGAATFIAKLWDGTTVFASARQQSAGANARCSITLSGAITSPAGNIRISVEDPDSVSGKILFNNSGLSKDSTITVMRIG